LGESEDDGGESDFLSDFDESGDEGESADFFSDFDESAEEVDVGLFSGCEESDFEDDALEEDSDFL
jgi:hypothetical protein